MENLTVTEFDGVEPVLFDDELIGPTGGEDYEKLLNKLVDIQERMQSGMKKHINPAQKKANAIQKRLDEASNGKYLPRDQFMALVEAKKGYVEFLKKCWTKWKELKQECDDLCKQHPVLWPKYFELANSEINEYYTAFDPEDIDNQENLHNDQIDTLDCLSESHLEEMKAYDIEILNENPFLASDWWNRKTQVLMENDALEFDSIQQMEILF